MLEKITILAKILAIFNMKTRKNESHDFCNKKDTLFGNFSFIDLKHVIPGYNIRGFFVVNLGCFFYPHFLVFALLQ